MKSLKEFVESYNCEFHISSLADGKYSGIMTGYNFTYNGQVYKCDTGFRGRNLPITLEIKNGKIEKYYN